MAAINHTPLGNGSKSVSQTRVLFVMQSSCARPQLRRFASSHCDRVGASRDGRFEYGAAPGYCEMVDVQLPPATPPRRPTESSIGWKSHSDGQREAGKSFLSLAKGLSAIENSTWINYKTGDRPTRARAAAVGRFNPIRSSSSARRQRKVSRCGTFLSSSISTAATCSSSAAARRRCRSCACSPRRARA